MHKDGRRLGKSDSIVFIISNRIVMKKCYQQQDESYRDKKCYQQQDESYRDKKLLSAAGQIVS